MFHDDSPNREPVRKRGKGIWYPPPGWRQAQRREGKVIIRARLAIRRARKSKGV